MNITTTITVLLSSLMMVSCSSSGGSTESNEQSELGIQSDFTELTETTPVNTNDFIGTWFTDCLPSTDLSIPGSRDTFIYDGGRAVFNTQTFSDAACENMQSFVTKTGTITFGQGIVESTFGVLSHEIRFASDDSVTDNFLDIVYTRGDQLYFGDKNSRSDINQAPIALDTSRRFNYSGFPDFSVLDSLSITVPLTIEVENFNGSQTRNSNERAVIATALILDVTINDLFIPLSLDAGTGNRVGITTVDANSTVSANVKWSEESAGRILVLASSSTNISVASKPLTILFTADEYDTSFDADQDGVDNLTERNQGTDPYDSNSN